MLRSRKINQDALILGIVALIGIVALVFYGMQINARHSSDEALAAHRQEQREATARQNHERRLAWQRKHPKEYAAQKAALRAQITRRLAERRAVIIAEAARRREADAAERSRQESERRNAEAARVAAIDAEARSGCKGAYYYQRAAVGAENNDSYQQAYDAAVAGLARVGDCEEVDLPALKGRLLGTKALSEHHLSSGDSKTDLNQAITLLAECQTQPGYYGESSGASCETEEETLISYKTNWEMAEYEGN